MKRGQLDIALFILLWLSGITTFLGLILKSPLATCLGILGCLSFGRLLLQRIL